MRVLYEPVMHRHGKIKTGIHPKHNGIAIVQNERVTLVVGIMSAPDNYSLGQARQRTIERPDEITDGSIWVFTRQGATGMRPS